MEWILLGIFITLVLIWILLQTLGEKINLNLQAIYEQLIEMEHLPEAEKNDLEKKADSE